MTVPESPQKVLAVFGPDLAGTRTDFLVKKVKQEQFHIVALDSLAMGIAGEAGLPYTVIDDWLAPETILQAERDALLGERSWFEPAREEFTVDGICWPEVDQFVMRGFWAQSMMALALGRAFQERGCRLLSFFSSYFPRPAIVWSLSDIAGTLWQTQSWEKIEKIKTFALTDTDLKLGALWKKVVMRLRSRLAKRQESQSRSTAVSPVLHDKIVVVAAYAQKDRYAHTVNQLRDHFPGKVAIVMPGGHADLADKLQEEWSIPVIPGPLLPVFSIVSQMPSWLTRSCDAQLSRRFVRAYEKCVGASKGRPWHVPLKAAPFHFRYYSTHWWPTHCRNTARFWIDLIREHRPAAVMVSAIEAPTEIVPCIAARKVGVPAFVLPEAAARTLYFSGLFGDTVFLCDLSLQNRLLERSGYRPEQLISVRSILSDRQYESKHAPTFKTRDKLRVLVLTNPTGVPGLLMRHLDLRAQYQALQILANPPAGVERFLELRLKVHPVYHDMEMITSVSKDLASRVLPPDTGLDHALASSDLVVALNYQGSALVYCLRDSKAVILLWTEPDSFMASPQWCSDLYKSGLTEVHDAKQFWEAIERFRHDPHVRSEMEQLSQTFAREHLDQSGFPPLHQVLRRILY